MGRHLEGPRSREAAPGGTKGAWGQRPEGHRVLGVAPGRTQVAWGDVQEDQGRVGRHPEGLRARWLAPWRMIIGVVVVTVVIVQLDWLRIAEWAYAGIFAVAVRFQNQDQFWIPHQKLHVACVLDFFDISKNKLVWPNMLFLAICLQNRSLSENIEF